jgi:acetoin utilization protein AcuC
MSGYQPHVNAVLVYAPALAAYDLGQSHPLKPERFTLAVDLLADAGLLDGPGAIDVVAPAPATWTQLSLAHTPAYLDALAQASESPDTWVVPRAGLGTGDDPVFPGMYDVAALVAGSTLAAVDEVVSGRHGRAMSIAGGLHHAHADRASGFCVVNDVAVAIAAALAQDADLRVAYVDIDAHHGDGVQDIFYAEPRALTVSIHESGRFLFPGSGFPDETGALGAEGTSANLPMPPGATDACYRLGFKDLVAPVVRAYSPDLIVAQLGADAHHADPLTTLGLTLPGHAWLVDAIVRLADEVCGGRLVATGGGGYGAFSVVPRAWASATARLAEVRLGPGLPEAWRRRVERLGVVPSPTTLLQDDWRPDPTAEAELLEETRRSVEVSRAALRDYLDLG